jgi:hypothetical protein
MRRISGRCQRGIRYALWALGEATTMEILEYCYPWPGEDRRQRKNRARAVCLAARKMAVVVGRAVPQFKFCSVLLSKCSILNRQNVRERAML